MREVRRPRDLKGDLARGSDATEVRTPRSPRSFKSQAIALLARRDYARAELAGKLRLRGANATEVDAVLDELIQLGYLSNARYAKAIVGQKASRYSHRYVVEELKAKGVDASEIEQAFDEAAPADDAATLLAVWQRKFDAPPANEREKARQIRFLQSRGFGLSAILRLLREQTSASVEIPDHKS